MNSEFFFDSLSTSPLRRSNSLEHLDFGTLLPEFDLPHPIHILQDQRSTASLSPPPLHFDEFYNDNNTASNFDEISSFTSPKPKDDLISPFTLTLQLKKDEISSFTSPTVKPKDDEIARIIPTLKLKDDEIVDVVPIMKLKDEKLTSSELKEIGDNCVTSKQKRRRSIRIQNLNRRKKRKTN